MRKMLRKTVHFSNVGLEKMLRVKSFSNTDKETMTYAQGLRRRYIGIGTQNM